MELDWRQLVLRLHNNDTTALETIMQSCVVPLTRLAYRIVGSRDTADDIVQDVLVYLWEHRHTLDPERSIRALLFSSVRSRALDVLKYDRVRARHRQVEDAEGDVAVSSLVVESHEETVLTHTTYAETVRHLPERFQTALRLRLELQLSYAELAQVMNISANAATQLVLRAREAFLRQLTKKHRP